MALSQQLSFVTNRLFLTGDVSRCHCRTERLDSFSVRSRNVSGRAYLGAMSDYEPAKDCITFKGACRQVVGFGSGSQGDGKPGFRPWRQVAEASRGTGDADECLTQSMEEQSVLGLGGVGVDFLARVEAFPHPDAKIRTKQFQIQGGGNVGNALTAAARLGLKPRIISKIADDFTGQQILGELHANQVDTSHLIVSQGGNSPLTYIIVDDQSNTRTCIHTPGQPPMEASELSSRAIEEALTGVSLVYFDGRLANSALKLAAQAAARMVPILVDAERPREGLDQLLPLAQYIVASADFPQMWTGADGVADALVKLMHRLPELRFVVVTLGEHGSLLLERGLKSQGGLSLPAPSSVPTADSLREELLKDLFHKSPDGTPLPTPRSCSTQMVLMRGGAEEGAPVFTGRLTACCAKAISKQEMVDTTGAGDAFIGAVLYALCAKMPIPKMLTFASTVAAINCQTLGARSGLPYREDSRLAMWFEHASAR